VSCCPETGNRRRMAWWSVVASSAALLTVLSGCSISPRHPAPTLSEPTVSPAASDPVDLCALVPPELQAGAMPSPAASPPAPEALQTTASCVIGTARTPQPDLPSAELHLDLSRYDSADEAEHLLPCTDNTELTGLGSHACLQLTPPASAGLTVSVVVIAQQGGNVLQVQYIYFAGYGRWPDSGRCQQIAIQVNRAVLARL
jgi:hypothetical protein